MSDTIKDFVKKRYTEVLEQRSGSCCEPDCCGPDSGIEVAESYEKTDGYVADADYGLGCGIPTEHARIQEGQTVLDLGSGAGNDVFVARRLVGDSGYVIGLDMTEAMVARAKENQSQLGFNNVEFVLGDIEAMPLPDQHVDVVISNCVMNLVPDKEQAYREVYRVLRPGGHFSISDIVIQDELPDNIRQAAEMYAGCIAGAMDMDEYLAIIRRAGFKEVNTPKVKKIEVPDEVFLQYLSKEELAHYRAHSRGIFSITVVGEK